MSSDWYSIRRAMKNIRARVLWFQDEDDEITPLSDVLKVKAENYPNIEFVITKGLGHRRIYRDNKVAQSVVDFYETPIRNIIFLYLHQFLFKKGTEIMPQPVVAKISLPRIR